MYTGTIFVAMSSVERVKIINGIEFFNSCIMNNKFCVITESFDGYFR